MTFNQLIIFHEVKLTFCFIVNYSSEVLDAKLSLIVVLWRDVVCVEFVLKVELVQHGGVCALQETQRPTETKRYTYFLSLFKADYCGI